MRAGAIAGLTVLAIAAGQVAAGPGCDAAEPPKISAGGIHLGGPIAGPDVDGKSMSGKVVLLELWGINCPPCETTMPMLEAIHRTLGPQGLLVIGAHIQQGTDDDVRRAVKSLGVTFPIVGNTGIEGLEQISQMPCTLLFDHTGKCVFMGSVTDAEQAVAAAVAAAPPQVLNGRPLEKLASLYPMLKNEAQFGAALKKARGMTSTKDEDTADEAKFVVEKLEAWGRDMVDKAPETRIADPTRALEMLQRCATAFKGDPLGSEAAKLVTEWKKDKDFQAAVKCGQQLAKLEGMRSGLIGGARVVTPDAAAAVPAAVKRQMKDLVNGVQKGAPGTKMAERAAEIATEFGLGDVPGR